MENTQNKAVYRKSFVVKACHYTRMGCADTSWSPSNTALRFGNQLASPYGRFMLAQFVGARMMAETFMRQPLFP